MTTTGWFDGVTCGEELHDTRVYVDPGGVVRTGWYLCEDGWRYISGGHRAAGETVLLGGKPYTFDETGLWIG